MKKGDRVRVIAPSTCGSDWLHICAEATVDYLLPDYGKIICVLDVPSGPHKSCCLYSDEENIHWEAA